jgi:hypothetical protein
MSYERKFVTHFLLVGNMWAYLVEDSSLGT